MSPFFHARVGREVFMKYNDKNKPLVCMMTQSTCYKGTRKFTPKGILWHDTGANNPTLKRYVQPDDNVSNRTELIEKLGKNQYNNDWNHIDRQAGMNCWVGKLADGTVATVQTMPWDFRPWGCGSGSKGSCNDTHIQFEICEDGKTDRAYLEAAYREACEITAYLCKMFGIDPHGTIDYKGIKVPTILCHQDSYKLGLGSNHSDTYDWFPQHGKSMETVRNDVAAILAADGTVPVTEPTVPAGLTKGDKGEEVKAMQTMLIACGYSCGPDGADGDFGKNTLAGLQKFQAAVGLTVSGVYDEKTRAALEKAYTERPTTSGLQATELKALSDAEVIQKVGPLFTADQQKSGVLASVSLAQFILESGYGKSELAQNANNCFGMKKSLSGNTWGGSTWDGSVYTKQTKEQKADGSYVTITADFRKYACVEDSIADHSAYLLGAKKGDGLRYEGLKGCADYRKAAQIIKDGGYATSLTYVDKLCDIIDRWHLTQYDALQPAIVTEPTPTEPVPTEPTPTEPVPTEAEKTVCTAEKVIAVAVAEIGYHEKASNSNLDSKTANSGSANYTKYARDFDQKYPNWYNGKKNGYAWCDMFVDWCFLTAFGYETALKLLCQPEKSAGAGCTYSLRYFKNKGQFHTSGPKPGDQIFFGTSQSDSSHTGLVEKVDGSKVYTIEGNSSDQVIRRSYALNNSRILGYGRPAYDAVEDTVPTTPTTPATPTTTKYYRVRKSWKDKSSQIGAFTVLQNAVNCVDANPGYAAFDDDGNQVYPEAKSLDVPFLVRVAIDDLNIRKGAGTNYSRIGEYTGKGTFTIVEVAFGNGSNSGWGKLKSGAGWISLDYAQRI